MIFNWKIHGKFDFSFHKSPTGNPNDMPVSVAMGLLFDLGAAMLIPLKRNTFFGTF